MILEHQWNNESVCRTLCAACGCSGPMAKSVEAAQFLAVVCDWNEKNGICPACQKLRTDKGGKKPRREKQR